MFLISDVTLQGLAFLPHDCFSLGGGGGVESVLISKWDSVRARLCSGGAGANHSAGCKAHQTERDTGVPRSQETAPF